MSHGVDVRLDAMQASSPAPMLDRASPEPQVAKLRARDHSMLPLGDRRDRDIRLQNYMTVMRSCNRVRHGPEFRGRGVTRVRAGLLARDAGED